MWKYVSTSQIGSSHLASGEKCQDFCKVEEISTAAEVFLCFACSDGAGSASHAEQGSLRACELFVEMMKDLCVSSKFCLADISRSDAALWVDSIRTSLQEDANAAGVSVREFACTLLGGVISQNYSVFLQVGDGAIVIHSGEMLEPVFWPQSGEYINTTNFVTDEKASEVMEFSNRGRIEDLVVFTDGLERLMLKWDERIVFEPALRPMLKMLKSTPAEGVGALEESLGRFLSSEVVSSKTDDDKSLILATRRDSDESLL